MASRPCADRASGWVASASSFVSRVAAPMPSNDRRRQRLLLLARSRDKGLIGGFGQAGRPGPTYRWLTGRRCRCSRTGWVNELAGLEVVPLNRPVHKRVGAGSRSKGDEGSGLLGAFGHALVRAGPRWATVASEWGQMSLFRSPSPFGSEARGPSSKRKSDATQPSRRARTY